MGIFSLAGQLGPLGNTKPVLLIGYYQTQVLEYGGIGHQCMGADYQIHIAAFNGGPCILFLLGRQRTGQQAGTDTKGGQQSLQRFVMLLCQDFCRCH